LCSCGFLVWRVTWPKLLNNSTSPRIHGELSSKTSNQAMPVSRQSQGRKDKTVLTLADLALHQLPGGMLPCLLRARCTTCTSVCFRTGASSCGRDTAAGMTSALGAHWRRPAHVRPPGAPGRQPELPGGAAGPAASLADAPDAHRQPARRPSRAGRPAAPEVAFCWRKQVRLQALRRSFAVATARSVK